MKNLKQFVNFDLEAFLKGKRLVVTSVADWLDYESKKKLGTKVETVIFTDKTEYIQKNGQKISNQFEKLTIKVSKDVNVELSATVIPVGATATVYGDYQNLLSIKATDIQVVESKKVE